MLTLPKLRTHASAHTLFSAPSLQAAFERMRFVQADPIRAPARAQDLILRQRVADFRVGDLERAYAALDLDEDYLYAYGFMARSLSSLLTPRAGTRALSAYDRRVLSLVRELGVVHPRDLDAQLGKKRVVNAWGGFSQATKRSLERLHEHGLVRVVGRKSGVRLYRAIDESLPPAEPRARFEGLVMAIATVLAPVRLRTLQSMAARVRRIVRGAGDHRALIDGLLRSGALERDEYESATYLWPSGSAAREPGPRVLRFLAPFDPLVWDRARLEQLWGFRYRFEAYTPIEKRVRGYYALPVAWGDAVIGWANVSGAAGTLDLELGFVDKRPSERAFSRELDAEVERLRLFLTPRFKPDALEAG